MNNKKYTAFVLGSSGLIGKNLLEQLVDNTLYETIYAVSRKPLSIIHPKIKNIISDIENIDNQILNIKTDHLYLCVGTTKKKSPDRTDYIKIDHDYPVRIAKSLKKNNCRVVNLVSSIGADITAKSFYLRLKGEVEKSIINIGFETTNIFRPSVLLGKRSEFRLGEEVAKAVLQTFSFVLCCGLEKYKGVSAETVAKSMIYNSLNSKKGVFIFNNKDINN